MADARMPAHRNKIETALFKGLEVGVFFSFLGAYFSVSLIGLGTGLVLFCGISLLLLERRFEMVTENPVFVPVLFLSVAILLSILFAEPYDFTKPLGKIRYLICVFFFAWYFAERPSARTQILRLCQGVALLLAVVALLQFFGIFSPLPLFGGNAPALLPNGGGRFFIASGFAFHHNPFAATVLLLFHVLLAHALVGAHRWRYLVPAAACVVALFCSFSRGAWIAGCISTMVVAGLAHWRILVRLGMGMVALVASLFYFNPYFRSRVLDIRPSRNEDRLELWRICLEMFKDSPWLGQGFYSFGSRYQRYTDWHLHRPHFPIEAHNMYLDLLSGTGIVGMGSFVCFLLSWLRLALSEYRHKNAFTPWALASVGMFCSFAVGGAFDKLFYMTQTLVPNVLFLGILSSQALARKLNGHKA